MKLYQRNSETIVFKNLPTTLKETVYKHCKLYNITDFEQAIISCIQTTSEKKTQSFFKKLFSAPVKPIQIITILSDTCLILVETSGSFVFSYQLKDIEINTQMEAIYAKQNIEDFGVDIFGFQNGANKKSSYFLGLGKDDAGQGFKNSLLEQLGSLKSSS